MRSPDSSRQNTTITLGLSPEACRAIVPYQPFVHAALFPNSESGNNNCTSSSRGGNAAEISVSDDDPSEESFDLETEEDDAIPIGSGFVFEDEFLNELMNDRFGQKRIETEAKKRDLVGTSVNVTGVCWTAREDIEDLDFDRDDFLEVGIRSDNLDFDSLPKRLRTQTEVLAGERASPRVPKEKGVRDESRAIHSIFQTLYPVNWRRSIRRLNEAIKKDGAQTRKKGKNEVSANEYWVFLGLLLLCAVQKSGGVDGLFRSKVTDGILKRVDASEYMSYSRFKYIKQFWMSQFELQLNDEDKEVQKWWRVGHLVQGFNNNRRRTVAASRVKTMDESMSAYRPQTRKTGNLPNISYILRKPEPLGTELKTVASIGSNGPIIYAEIQEGKIGMTNKPFFYSHGATCSCVLRLGQGTKDSGQHPDPLVRNLFYGDSWFASFKTAVAVAEELNSVFLGPVKTSHRQFPKNYLETTMREWPPGSHLVLETMLRGKKYYSIGYKYNVKKVLCLIATEGAGHSMPGTPYEAKWLDPNGRMASRMIPRPHLLSEYFKHSNQIDKHNHARQSQLAIEKNVVTQDGYFRLFCTYLGITVTDAWKLYRDGLGDKCPNKEMSILEFANILCKTNLLNDYSKNNYESTPKPTLPSLSLPYSRQNLSFPEQLTLKSHPTISTLGSGTNGLVDIGNGKVLPS